MENPKQSNNVVKIGHNSNRSITQETVEKLGKRILHITVAEIDAAWAGQQLPDDAAEMMLG